MATIARAVLAAAYIPTAATIAARLLDRDGANYVGQRYFAAPDVAAIARRTAAARLRADAIRGVPSALRELRGLLKPVAGETQPGRVTCAWCSRAVCADHASVELGGRLVHARPCAGEFEALVYGEG